MNYLKNQIKDYFGDGEHWGAQITYLEENQPLKAGALSLCQKSHKRFWYLMVMF